MAPPKQLDGWKAVANHLGVTVRTAQEWEKERGLPVRRRGEGSRPRVFAYADELDAWLASQEEQAAQPLSASIVHRRWFWPSFAGLLFVLFFSGWFLWPRVGVPVGVERVGSEINVVDERGRIRWVHRFSALGEQTYGQYPPGSAEPGFDHLVVDVDGDGDIEVLFVEHPADGRGVSSTLHCFDQDGNPVWQFRFGRERTLPHRVFPDVFHGYLIGVVSRGSERFVVAHGMQQPFFPDQIVLLNPHDGLLVGEYWHSGRVYATELLDLDGDGVEELLLGAANNPDDGIGHAALVALNIPFGKGSSEIPNYFGDPGGNERAYLLFPRPSVFDAEQRAPNAFSIVPLDSDQIQVEVGVSFAKLIYYLDFDLRFLAVHPSDDLKRRHSEFYSEGKLKEPVEAEQDSWSNIRYYAAAPNANDPAIEREFQRAGAAETQ